MNSQALILALMFEISPLHSPPTIRGLIPVEMTIPFGKKQFLTMW